MRTAIFGDIHGNTEALDAVFADMERAAVDRRLCLGDVVGYGAEPSACVQRLRRLGVETIQGNHDSAAVGGTPLDYFNPFARDAIVWTRQRLGEAEAEWLKGLPLVREYGGFTVVHATLANPGEWGYILDFSAARRCLELLPSGICFIGHSHVPVVFQDDGSLSFHREAKTRTVPGVRYIVNVGSVGQPRDGDPRASYAVHDARRGTVEIRRVEYDFRSTQDKIVAAGLPEFLAVRLEAGR